MKLNITPGPWKVTRWHNENVLSIVKECNDFPGGRRLTEIAYNIKDEDHARLIAAAPELLNRIISVYLNTKSEFEKNSMKGIIERATGKSIGEVINE